MSAFDILGEIIDTAADVVGAVFGASSNNGPRPAQVSGGVTGKQQAREFIKHLRNEALTANAVVIEYEAKWKWFRNPEWRQLVLEELKQIGLFRTAEFSAPCSMDSEWSFGGYIKHGPAIATASLDSRM